MAIKSVYIAAPKIADSLLHIRDTEHHHLTVTRARPGEAIEIFDGRGNVWDAEIVAIERRETIARVTATRSAAAEAPELILGMSLIRPSAFDLAIEKAVETGVSRIVPVIAARSNTKPAGGERWQRIIVESAKQAKRYHLPALEAPVPFSKIVERDSATKIVFAERDAKQRKPVLSGAPVLYLIGPEGGWTDDELNTAAAHGFSFVSLGSTILRAETAAAIATFLLRYES